MTEPTGRERVADTIRAVLEAGEGGKSFTLTGYDAGVLRDHLAALEDLEEGRPIKVYMPSHWRETIREYPGALIGFHRELSDHDAEVEDWEEVLVYPVYATEPEEEG